MDLITALNIARAHGRDPLKTTAKKCYYYEPRVRRLFGPFGVTNAKFSWKRKDYPRTARGLAACIGQLHMADYNARENCERRVAAGIAAHGIRRVRAGFIYRAVE